MIRYAVMWPLELACAGLMTLYAMWLYNRGDARGYLYLRRQRRAGNGRHQIRPGRHAGQIRYIPSTVPVILSHVR